MKAIWIGLAAIGLVACGAQGAAQTGPSEAIAAAVSDPARPATDTARDENRKPAAIVAFAGVKPGDKVAELIPAGGYYTRILAKAVGPKGHVYAIVPSFFANRPGGLDGINAIAKDYGNVTVVLADTTDFTVPEPVDLVWTSENYHDMHNGPAPNPAADNAAAFKALKPGGLYYIEDHAAAAGAGTTVTSTLHRIDPAAVISEVTAAGFKLDAQSDLLANLDDPHDKPVFDPSIRGHTDKLAMRFKKPTK
jgi:predicted methyltransferase